MGRLRLEGWHDNLFKHRCNCVESMGLGRLGLDKCEARHKHQNRQLLLCSLAAYYSTRAHLLYYICSPQTPCCLVHRCYTTASVKSLGLLLCDHTPVLLSDSQCEEPVLERDGRKQRARQKALRPQEPEGTLNEEPVSNHPGVSD